MFVKEKINSPQIEIWTTKWNCFFFKNIQLTWTITQFDAIFILIRIVLKYGCNKKNQIKGQTHHKNCLNRMKLWNKTERDAIVFSLLVSKQCSRQTCRRRTWTQTTISNVEYIVLKDLLHVTPFRCATQCVRVSRSWQLD